LYVYTLFEPPHPSPLTTPLSGQKLFCPLLQFHLRENIRNNKKDIAFLLVWDKDSYTETFLALLPCICELQPHCFISTRPLHYSWSPSHSGLCQFKITIFTPLQWAHQPHSSFRFPFLFLPCVFSP
jgi:hypothetical protein